LGAIDDVIATLRALQPLMHAFRDVSLAIGYLEKMKRPRSDKQTLGKLAKDAIAVVMSAHGAQT